MLFNNRKNIRLILLCLACAFCLTGCGTSNKSSFSIKKQGKKNAVSYIEGKYGVEPKIVDTKVLWGTGYAPPGLLPSISDIGPNGYLKCKMEIDGEQFDLVIIGDEVCDTGFDNYEKALIDDAIVKDISDTLSISCEHSLIRFSNKAYSNNDSLINIRFTDLQDFYNQTHTFVYYFTVDDIDESLVEKFSQKYTISQSWSLLRVYLVQYNDASNIPLGNEWFTDYKPEYDANVLDFYDVYLRNGKEENLVYHFEK